MKENPAVVSRHRKKLARPRRLSKVTPSAPFPHVQSSRFPSASWSPGPLCGVLSIRFWLPLAVAFLLALLLLHNAPPTAWAHPSTNPAVPRNVQVTPGHAALTLSWQAPSAWGSFPAGGYEIDWYAGASTPADASAWSLATPVGSPLAATVTSFTFTGTHGDHTVANGVTYQLRIRALTVNPNDDNHTLPSLWVVASGTPAQQLHQLQGNSPNRAPAVVSPLADVIGLVEQTGRSISLSGVFNDPDGDTLTFSAASSNVATVKTLVFLDSLTVFGVAAGSATVTVTADDGNGSRVSDAFDVSVVAVEGGRGGGLPGTGVQPVSVQSGDATLSGLTAQVSSDGTNFSALGFWPEFAADIDRFRTSMPASFTHLKVTPTVNQADATVRVGRSLRTLVPVPSGSASGAFALDTGFTWILIQVTAQNGSTQRLYRLGITRGARGIPAPPRNVQVAPGNGFLTLIWDAPVHWGSWGAGGYEIDWYAGSSPPTQFSDWNRANPVGELLPASDTSYTFSGTYGGHTVANGQTYQLQIRAVSGTDPEGSNDRLPSVWDVVSGAPDASAAPIAPRNLNVTEGNARLDLTWTAPPGTVTGYDAHYTSASEDDVANDATASGNDASAAWVDDSHTGTMASHAITSLTNGVDYRVRVRAVSANGSSKWIFGTGTPVSTALPTIQFRASSIEAAETTGTLQLTVTSDSAPSEDIQVAITFVDVESTNAGLNFERNQGTSSPSDCVAADYISQPKTVTIAAGATTSSAAEVTICDDSLLEHDEYFVLGIGSGTGYVAGERSRMTVAIRDDEWLHQSPGKPTLAAITSGQNQPTATSLSFNVGCVHGVSTVVTGYFLLAINRDDSDDWQLRRFSAELTCQDANRPSVLRTMEDLPGRQTATTYVVRARSRNIFGRYGLWSEPIEVATPAATN